MTRSGNSIKPEESKKNPRKPQSDGNGSENTSLPQKKSDHVDKKQNIYESRSVDSSDKPFLRRRTIAEGKGIPLLKHGGSRNKSSGEKKARFSTSMHPSKLSSENSYRRIKSEIAGSNLLNIPEQGVADYERKKRKVSEITKEDSEKSNMDFSSLEEKVKAAAELSAIELLQLSENSDIKQKDQKKLEKSRTRPFLTEELQRNAERNTEEFSKQLKGVQDFIRSESDSQIGIEELLPDSDSSIREESLQRKIKILEDRNSELLQAKISLKLAHDNLLESKKRLQEKIDSLEEGDAVDELKGRQFVTRYELENTRSSSIGSLSVSPVRDVNSITYKALHRALASIIQIVKRDLGLQEGDSRLEDILRQFNESLPEAYNMTLDILAEGDAPEKPADDDSKGESDSSQNISQDETVDDALYSNLRSENDALLETIRKLELRLLLLEEEQLLELETLQQKVTSLEQGSNELQKDYDHRLNELQKRHQELRDSSWNDYFVQQTEIERLTQEKQNIVEEHRQKEVERDRNFKKVNADLLDKTTFNAVLFQQLTTLQESKEELNQTYLKREKELQDNLQDSNIRCDDLSKTNADLLKEIKLKEGFILANKERINRAEEEKSDIVSQLEEMKQELEFRKKREDEIEKLQRQLKNKEEEIGKLTRKDAEYEIELNSLEDQLKDVKDRLSQTEKRREALEQRYNQLREQNRKQDEESNKVLFDLNTAQNTIEALEAVLLTRDKEKLESNQKQRKLESDNEALRHKIERLAEDAKTSSEMTPRSENVTTPMTLFTAKAFVSMQEVIEQITEQVFDNVHLSEETVDHIGQIFMAKKLVVFENFVERFRKVGEEREIEDDSSKNAYDTINTNISELIQSHFSSIEQEQLDGKIETFNKIIDVLIEELLKDFIAGIQKAGETPRANLLDDFDLENITPEIPETVNGDQINQISVLEEKLKQQDEWLQMQQQDLDGQILRSQERIVAFEQAFNKEKNAKNLFKGLFEKEKNDARSAAEEMEEKLRQQDETLENERKAHNDELRKVEKNLESSEKNSAKLRSLLNDERGGNRDRQARIDALESDMAKEISRRKKMMAATNIALTKEIGQRTRIEKELQISKDQIAALEVDNARLRLNQTALSDQANALTQENITLQKHARKAQEEAAKAKEEAAQAKKETIIIREPVYIEAEPKVKIIEKVVQSFEPHYQKAALQLFGDINDPNNKESKAIKIDYYRHHRKHIHRGDQSKKHTQVDLSHASDEEIVAQIKKDDEMAIKNNMEKLVELIVDQGINEKVMEKIPAALIMSAIAFGAPDDLKDYKELHPKANLRKSFCHHLEAGTKEAEIRNKAFQNIVDVMEKYGALFGIVCDEEEKSQEVEKLPAVVPSTILHREERKLHNNILRFQEHMRRD